MDQAVQSTDAERYEALRVEPSRRRSFLRFLGRYPIFFLAFGPPLLRSGAIDATRGRIDFWSVFQVCLIASIALRAIYRLASAESILIPRQIRSILRFALFLGLLFLASAAYSPSRRVSLAYSVAYFLTFACIVEFIVDVYWTPPNWLQCLFHLRFIALLLLALDFIVLPFDSKLVLEYMEGSGLHFGGGTVGPVPLICPMIAIISAYTFLHSLESKSRSAFFLLVGLAGTLVAQSRGCELALLLSLSILTLGWAKTGKRSGYIFISGLLASVLLFAVFMGAFGGGRIWNAFNKGQSTESIETASGRTEMWQFVLDYCLKHPQGMGYVAGFRMFFREYRATGLTLDPTHIGNAHNSHLQVLADAGWLALVIYLILLTRIVRMAWRFANRRFYLGFVPDGVLREPLECLLCMLIFCLGLGMSSAGFSVPLQVAFYWQNIIVALILGISANVILACRARSVDSAN